MNNEEKAALIVCHPKTYEYFKSESNDNMPPKEGFVITGVVRPEIVFVVARDDFVDWLDKHGSAWTM